MGKIYDLYSPYQRTIDNLKRKIKGYEKMKKDLTNQNRKLNKENRKYKEVFSKIKEYINGAYEMATYTKSVSLDEENIEDLLDILKEVE